MTFLDSTVPGRLLVTDTGTEEVMALFASEMSLRGSSLLVAELLRLATKRGIGGGEAERLIARMSLLSVDDVLMRAAGRLITPGTWVRTADAIHLAAALRLGERVFLTYDRVQACGAEALGLEVHSPGMPDGWWRGS